MKVKILRDYDHRISEARVQAFTAGTEVDVPRATADLLMNAKPPAAEAVAKPTTPAEKE